MLEELQQKYLASLSDKADELRTAARELQQGDRLAETRLRTLAHSLHGSGATFGYPQISEAAKAAETASAGQLDEKVQALVALLQQTAANPGASPAADAINILIIDDDADFAASIKAGFDQKGGKYNVQHASTCVKAQELLIKQNFAIILLDLVMPDRDGRDLLREIKYEFGLPTPVYVLSGIEKDLIRIECMALGADKFISKPVDAQALATTIDKLLQKNVKRELSLVPMGSEANRAEVAAAGAVPAASKISVDGKLVMVAEDDSMQAAAIRTRLQKEGITADHVVNGNDFLAKMRDKPYALFILDINIPKPDGFELLQRIRKDAVTATTPVIMLTAMGSESDIIRAYDLGADDYILKPYSAIQLVARVKSLLKKAR